MRLKSWRIHDDRFTQSKFSHVFTLAKCENDPSRWLICVWSVLITKPDLPSVASGCIYQTRGRIIVLHVLKRKKILRLWVFTNRCLQPLFTSFILFCHWLLLSLLCQIPDTQQRRTHIFLTQFSVQRACTGANGPATAAFSEFVSFIFWNSICSD